MPSVTVHQALARKLCALLNKNDISNAQKPASGQRFRSIPGGGTSIRSFRSGSGSARRTSSDNSSESSSAGSRHSESGSTPLSLGLHSDRASTSTSTSMIDSPMHVLAPDLPPQSARDSGKRQQDTQQDEEDVCSSSVPSTLTPPPTPMQERDTRLGMASASKHIASTEPASKASSPWGVSEDLYDGEGRGRGNGRVKRGQPRPVIAPPVAPPTHLHAQLRHQAHKQLRHQVHHQQQQPAQSSADTLSNKSAIGSSSERAMIGTNANANYAPRELERRLRVMEERLGLMQRGRQGAPAYPALQYAAASRDGGNGNVLSLPTSTSDGSMIRMEVRVWCDPANPTTATSTATVERRGMEGMAQPAEKTAAEGEAVAFSRRP